MASYDEGKLTKLGALKQLAERIKKDYATKAELTATGNKYATKEELKTQISSTYKPGGSYKFASLPKAAADTLGMVYNVTDAFTTTESFLEGAGKAHPAGTNVVVISDVDTYKYDVLAGFVDLSEYVTKVSGKQLSTNDYTTEEKNKLAGLNNYTHPASAGGGSKTSALYKIATDANGHVSTATAATSADITALGVKITDTTYNDASQTVHGLMSTADKKKLDGMDFATDVEVGAMLDAVFGASA